jgi:hypothetical protein
MKLHIVIALNITVIWSKLQGLSCCDTFVHKVLVPHPTQWHVKVPLRGFCGRLREAVCMPLLVGYST